MNPPPTAVQRALAGLVEGSGRTLIIAGAAYTGKTEFLDTLRTELESAGARVIRLEGSYRERAVPYAATADLLDRVGHVSNRTLVDPPDPAPEALPLASPVGPEESRRGRRGRSDRHPLVIPSLGFVSRPRPAEYVEAPTVFSRIVEQLREPEAPPLAILVEDGAFFDSESRDVLLYLSERARLRPLLLAVVLDTSVPAYTNWEERLAGRGDVDWVRMTQPKPDPRDVARLKERYEALPETTRRVVGYVALFGGSATATYLSHVAHAPFRTVRSMLAPAVEAALVKIDERQVTIPGTGWAGVIVDLLPYAVREVMHKEISEAILAFHTEPNVHRRVQLAEHVYAWQHGPEAQRYLREAAEVTDSLQAFDTTEELVARALTCTADTPTRDAAEVEAHLRLWRSRLLVFTGQPAEAERDLVEGVTRALTLRRATDDTVEVIEGLWPALRVVGPRPSLITALGELADRAHACASHELEVLFLSLMAEHETARGRGPVARRDAERATVRAAQLEAPVFTAVADLTQALVRLDGFHDDREAADSLLRKAGAALESTRRSGFRARVEDLRGQLALARGEPKEAIAIHRQAIEDAIRFHALSFELEHQLGLAETLAEGSGNEANAAAPVRRARELADQLHLLPPSPPLLRLWILEGRLAAEMNEPDGARDHWSAVGDLPPAQAPPRLRAEALLRLVVLESQARNWVKVRELLGQLKAPELEVGLRQSWREWVERMHRHLGPGAEGFIEPPQDPPEALDP